MDDELNRVMQRINSRISNSYILSMLYNNANEIDYERYLKLGYSPEDIKIGSELISIYRQLKQIIENKYQLSDK